MTPPFSFFSRRVFFFFSTHFSFLFFSAFLLFCSVQQQKQQRRSPPAPHLKPTPSHSPAARLISFLSSIFAKQQQRSSRAVGWRSLSSPELQLPGDFRRCKLVVRDSILHLNLRFLDLGLIS